MEFRINLDAATEAEVRERAASSGQEPEAFVREAIREKLADLPGRQRLTLEDWREHLRKLVEIHKDAPASFDDSRDSIYPDRAA